MTPYQKGAVLTLLQNKVSHREIHRKTGIDRKTIRKLAQATDAPVVAAEPNSSTLATGSPSVAGQIPPPRPPAQRACPVKFLHPGHRLLRRPRRRLRRSWCPRMRARPVSRTARGLRRRCTWAATRWPSTRIWWINTASPRATTASSASAGHFASTNQSSSTAWNFFL